MNQETVDFKQFKRVLLIYNPNSGKQVFASMLSKVNELKELVGKLVGHKNVVMTELRSFDKLEGWADKIVAEKYDWVIVAGGDGTLRALIGMLEGCGYIPYISVFPAGTVNLVAKELLLTSNPIKWLQRVCKGHVVPVRMGKANGHIFLTVAGIGFDSLVVENVSSIEKKLLSAMAYVWQTTEVMRKELLFNDWRYSFKVRLDGETMRYNASSVIIGKSRYYGGIYSLFKSGNLTNDAFDVAIFTGNTREDFLHYAVSIVLESLHMDRNVLFRKAHTIEILSNEENFPVELDGDAVTTTPLKIEMHPVILRFLA